MENTNLQDLARRAAEANGEIEHFNTVETAPKTTPMQPEYHEDDVPTVFIGSPNPSIQNEPNEPEFPTAPTGDSVTTNTSTPKPIMPDLSEVDMSINPQQAGMSDKEIAEIAPHLPDELRSKVTTDLLSEKSKYKKQLILDGFTPEEAETAAENKFKKDIEKTDTNYAKENPEIGVIRMDKTDTAKEDLKLTPDEHDKLVTTKAIKLVLVEDAELKNIDIENVSTERKVDYIRNLEGSLSKYSVPVPIYGDYMSFRGAQLIQLANLESRDDDRLEDDLNRRASLIYSKLIGGTLIKKSDNSGKTIMNYQEFCNKFS